MILLAASGGGDSRLLQSTLGAHLPALIATQFTAG